MNTEDSLEIQIYGNASAPTLVYLPGLQGDWTCCAPFRRRIQQEVRLVQFSYPKDLRWTLADHAAAVEQKLRENKVTSGWLLAESFGSQVMWAFMNLPKNDFRVEGIILAGGFVRYPIVPLVRLASFLFQVLPRGFWRRFLQIYISYARRFRGMTREDAAELLQRQRNSKRETFRHRLRLIVGSDARKTAKNISCPLYYLSGVIDPIVPWFLVRPWLRKHCPKLAGDKILMGDHNVLGSATEGSAKQILAWMRQ